MTDKARQTYCDFLRRNVSGICAILAIVGYALVGLLLPQAQLGCVVIRVTDRLTPHRPRGARQ